MDEKWLIELDGLRGEIKKKIDLDELDENEMFGSIPVSGVVLLCD